MNTFSLEVLAQEEPLIKLDFLRNIWSLAASIKTAVSNRWLVDHRVVRGVILMPHKEIAILFKFTELI